ncbi:MAG TPA: serine hydrolase, partial [Chitinophagaceae bacterium]|nr:serine hydrolase [Chitinophagaceae bacterium]
MLLKLNYLIYPETICQILIQESNSETMAYNTRSTCLKCSLLAVILLFLQPCFSQYNFGKLDQLLEEKQKLLGKDFVLMIWSAGNPLEKKEDTLIYKKEVGEFKSKTIAPVASCSKWLTAALVMQFVDEGKISLDDK